MPPGVIQWLPGPGAVLGATLFNHKEFAGLHFTGSTSTLAGIIELTGKNLSANRYRSYPRIVGETGGKDFHFAAPDADARHFAYNTLRAAFEYQGQKCSACSRAYIPDNLWPEVRAILVEELAKVKVGQSDDFSSFMSAVIDSAAFKSITGYIDGAKADKTCEIVAGGTYDNSVGYFIQPTVVRVSDPKHKLMQEEIFGPVLSLYVYPAAEFEHTLAICDDTSPYALTGAVFARSRDNIVLAERLLANAAGNFYINDKCTGAVVGQQVRIPSALSSVGPHALHSVSSQRSVQVTDAHAALRWCACLGHERQGRRVAQPAAVGVAPHHQGELCAAHELDLPPHGGGQVRQAMRGGVRVKHALRSRTH